MFILETIKKYLRIYFGFSKSESRATLILMFLVTILVVTGNILKYKKINNPNEKLSQAQIKEQKLDQIKIYPIKKKLLHKNKITNATKAKPIKPETCISLSQKVNSTEEDRFIHQKKTNKPQLKKFDINTATTDQLKQIKGIGDVLSKRIIKFRDKLGGFFSNTQYKEVYGLNQKGAEELAKYSYVEKSFTPQKININTATIKELVAHPYIKYEIALIIVKHREKTGPFENEESFFTLCEKNNIDLKNIKPYIFI